MSKMKNNILWIFLIWLFLALTTDGRKHHLEISKDPRRFFPISTFGFYTGGWLAVNLTDFHFENGKDDGGEDEENDRELSSIFGFSIDKTASGALNPYVETSEGSCILDPSRQLPKEESAAILRFILDFKSRIIQVKCSDNIRSIQILANKKELDSLWKKQHEGGRLSDSGIFQKPVSNKSKRQSDGDPTAVLPAVVLSRSSCENVRLELESEKKENGLTYYNTSFVIYINNEKEEGLYSLYFHNCHNYPLQREDKVRVGFVIDIEEKNSESYLSAGEMPLPALYLLMASLFFLSGCFWVFILRKNGREQVFRIHWIMAALIYLKSLSLFFHGINYHKIETNGHHIESWAVLYYITHLLKGGLLFFTIVLIGSGWAFIKTILSDKEKRVFMIVLPMQVLANVAYIIMEESEEGEAIHNYWKDIFILVDLFCCGAILLPVVWSIRHLQDSSGADGKVTISLEKLKLFRHFYIMVVCYIYFTRIIVYLLKITVPFQYEWLDEMFREMATFVFFVMTGYKFRPASNNPYFSVPTDDFEIEEVLIGNTVVNETVTNRNTKKRIFVDDDEDSDDDGGMVFPPSKTESSHDLD